MTVLLQHVGAGEKYGLEVGDHAISENIVPCWDCRYCKRGDYNMCEFSQHWSALCLWRWLPSSLLDYAANMEPRLCTQACLCAKMWLHIYTLSLSLSLCMSEPNEILIFCWLAKHSSTSFMTMTRHLAGYSTLVFFLVCMGTISSCTVLVIVNCCVVCLFCSAE